MRKIAVLLVFTCISLHGMAQKGSNCPDDLVPKLGDNKMWGYANLFGHWVINPAYTKVSPFVESKAVVMKGMKYGVINCEGLIVIPAEYEKLSNFKYGKIWAMKDGLWGLLNDKGGLLLEHHYSQINPIAFTELSWVKKGDVWGLINEEKGTSICKPQFKIAQIMSENASLVQINPPYFGVVNHVNCGYLIGPTITRVKKVGIHTILFEQENKWGVFNEWGKVVSNAEFDSLASLRTVYDQDTKSFEIVLLAMKDKKFGLKGLSGTELLPIQYDDISEFSDVFFRVKQNGKYGFATRAGKVYIKPQYETAGLFYNGQAIVSKAGKYGVINAKNQFVVQANYQMIERNPEFKYYAIREKTGTGLYSLTGKKITPETFDSVYIADSSSYLRVSKAGKVKFYNVNKLAYPFEGSFDKAEPFTNGFAFVNNGNKWGVIDKKGKVVVPISFDKIEYDWFNNKMVFRTTLQGKIGITETSGKVLLPSDFELIIPSSPIYLKVRKDAKYAVLRNSGEAITEYNYDFISNELESPGVPEWPAVMVKKEKFGLLNEKGEEVLEAKAAKIEFLGEGLYSVKEKKDVIVVNSKGQPVGEGKYDEVREFNEGLGAVKIGSKWGFMDRSGKIKIKPAYEDAGLFVNHMAPVMINGKWGIIDVNGKELVLPEYEKYTTLSDGTRLLYKGGKEYTLMKGGILK